jgi:iron complex outermembrane receptor protein
VKKILILNFIFVRNYSKVLKIAPFLLAGTMMLEAQQKDSIKQKEIEQVVLIGYGKKKSLI